MTEATDKKKQDKLYQFVPSNDEVGILMPKTLILNGAPESRMLMGGFAVQQPKAVTLSVNTALQYHIKAENNPDYDYLIEGMENVCKRTQAKYGRGNAGSIVGIPLTRKEKHVINGVAKEVDVSNIGNMPDEYTPKSPEARALSELSETLVEKDGKLVEQDAYIKKLVAELESARKKSKE